MSTIIPEHSVQDSLIRSWDQYNDIVEDFRSMGVDINTNDPNELSKQFNTILWDWIRTTEHNPDVPFHVTLDRIMDSIRDVNMYAWEAIREAFQVFSDNNLPPYQFWEFHVNWENSVGRPVRAPRMGRTIEWDNWQGQDVRVTQMHFKLNDSVPGFPIAWLEFLTKRNADVIMRFNTLNDFQYNTGSYGLADPGETIGRGDPFGLMFAFMSVLRTLVLYLNTHVQ